MQLTPTVISALPLENALRDFLERNDLIGLESFLATQKAPDVADVLERFTEEDRSAVFTHLEPQLAAGVLAG